MKNFVAIVLLALALSTAQAQQILGVDKQEYTNVVLTTTTMTNMTQLLPEAPNGVIVAQVSVCSATNSSGVAYIVYGTNTVQGGGQQVTPGTCTTLNYPPRPQHALYGYIAGNGTGILAVTRQPSANQ